MKTESAPAIEPVLSRFTSVAQEGDFRLSFLHHLRFTRCRTLETASSRDLFAAMALAVRDRVLPRLWESERRGGADLKWVYYFSLEFLMGRMTASHLSALGIMDLAREALRHVGLSLDDLLEEERDAALGNGGLGRLAACYLDSLATLGYAAYGYGIFYEFGLFRQEILACEQRERPDYWSEYRHPWVLPRPDESVLVPVGGRVVAESDRRGSYNPMWMDWNLVRGEPHDIPVTGHGGRTVNLLRLFRARASEDFDVRIFNAGDYVEAVRRKIYSENISKVLYPAESSDAGRDLRLLQEYFLCACGVRDAVSRFRRDHSDWEDFPKSVAFQLNDTHPALAVAELQRFFVDEAGLPWETAWRLVRGSTSYTNHTLMPEALEKWPVAMLEKLIPRHLEIIYEINRRFLDDVRERGGPEDRVRRVSIFQEDGERSVRMANLSVVGGRRVNGVAALHTRLLKERVLGDFDSLYPGKILNVTNGVTPRRWLLAANPRLASAVSERIGTGWVTDLDRLEGLRRFADDEGFLNILGDVKKRNKERLLNSMAGGGAAPSPETLFDVQAKRLHEYKRQVLHLLFVVHRYLEILENPGRDIPPRAHWFAAKAAPGYAQAKLIIRLICETARVVNGDPLARGKLSLHFLPDYRVSLAEVLVPAADLSEQISLAGTEASGTGNMKFVLNGALLMGTWDGANIEIIQRSGEGVHFLFGMDAEEAESRKGSGRSHGDFAAVDARLGAALRAVGDDMFSRGDPGLFKPILNSLLEEGDRYMVLADFDSYRMAQEDAERVYYRHPREWGRRVVRAISSMGYFSSDRAVGEYARDIWDAQPCPGTPVQGQARGRDFAQRRGCGGDNP